MSSFSRWLRYTTIILLLITAGCGKSRPAAKLPDEAATEDFNSDPSNNPEVWNHAKLASWRIALEDPEVTIHFKKKSWSFFADIRKPDLAWMAVLAIENSEKPTEKQTLTMDDCKMIARSRSVQMINLTMVTNLDDEMLTLIAAIPQLRGILLRGDNITNKGIRALARCKKLELVSIDHADYVTDTGVSELSYLPQLQFLYLGNMTLAGTAFQYFVRSETVEMISLEWVRGFTDEGVKHFAKLPKLNDLRMKFRKDTVTTAGIRALVDARLPARFDFPKELIDDELLENLVARGWLHGQADASPSDKKATKPADIGHIDLSDAKVTDRGLNTILDCTNVRSLLLANTGVTDETLKKMSSFKSLQYLALGDTKVTAVGLEAIAGLPIKHLALERCDLTEDSFKAIAKMSTLEELRLPEAKTQSAWLKHLSTLPKLREVDLRKTAFDDSAVQYLVSLPSLDKLSLQQTNLGDKGFLELVALPKLISFNMDGTKVTKDVYLKAKKDRPTRSLSSHGLDK